MLCWLQNMQLRRKLHQNTQKVRKIRTSLVLKSKKLRTFKGFKLAVLIKKRIHNVTIRIIRMFPSRYFWKFRRLSIRYFTYNNFFFKDYKFWIRYVLISYLFTFFIEKYFIQLCQLLRPFRFRFVMTFCT